MTIDSIAPSLPGLTHPFLRPGTARSPAEQRRDAAKRTVSWILVAALHVFIVISFVISVHPFSQRGRPMEEMLLMLPADKNANVQHEDTPDVLNKAPDSVSSAPIIIPKIPPIEPPPDQSKGAPTPGDIMGMVGRELACAPGSWEHLTNTEQKNVCGGGPWRAYRAPNGSLVMIPPSQLPRLKQTPEPEFSTNTGADRIQRDLQNGQDPAMNGCPIMQNTPCVHVTPAMRNLNGN